MQFEADGPTKGGRALQMAALVHAECCVCAVQLDDGRGPHRCCCTHTAGSSSEHARSIQLQLARLLNVLFIVYNASPGPQGQVVHDEALMGSLLELLIPDLATASVALQLPGERRPPGCSWHSAACTAGVLNVITVGTHGMLGGWVAEGRGSAAGGSAAGAACAAAGGWCRS